MTRSTPEISETSRQLEVLSVTELSNIDWPEQSLLAVIQTDSTSLKARLHACEILLRRDEQKFLITIGAQTVATIYASALKGRITTDLNPWAFLGMGDLGPLGRHLVDCRDSAVTALAPLLDIKQAAGIYSGSKESKLGNSDNARICDFAAFFIARIKQLPYRFYRNDDALRDAETDRIRQQIDRRQ